MMEAVDLVRAGKAPKIAQDHSKKTYESWFRKDAAALDWARPVNEIYNIIRAANPAPGAWGTIKGNNVDIFDSAKTGATGRPGEILAISSEGMVIAASGGAIQARRVRGADGKKIAAAEWAKSAGIHVGDAFDKPALKARGG
jgi:methionyl-tRNA formyltransferase